MTTQRREQFVAATMAVLLGTALVLALLDALTYDRFFVVALVGFLVVVELTAPFGVQPRWRSRLRWLIALGLVLFAVVIAYRIIEMLPPGVL